MTARNILNEIVLHKRKEVEQRKATLPLNDLERSGAFDRRTYSIREYLLRPDKCGIIAEIKRKSPSRGVINSAISVGTVAKAYVRAGVSALSVLTDQDFFGGSHADLLEARVDNVCPILRKDFTIDEYQVYEARSLGADAILLIAAILSEKEVKAFTNLAHSLALEVLLEVHDEDELKRNLNANVDLIGVNNRDLKTFRVDLDTSRRLAPMIPPGATAVSESGIETPADIMRLRKSGYRGFLIGQTFMQQPDPGKAALEFVSELKKLEMNEHA